MFKLNTKYFALAVLLFITEVLIAKYLHDALIRPFGGDVLVVILMYCFAKSFVDTPVIPTALGVLLFAYLVEVSQYFNFVKLIGLEQYPIARVVMGTYFSVVDLVCYTLGILIVILTEKSFNNGNTIKN